MCVVVCTGQPLSGSASAFACVHCHVGQSCEYVCACVCVRACVHMCVLLQQLVAESVLPP